MVTTRHRRAASAEAAGQEITDPAAAHALDLLEHTTRWVAHADNKASLSLATAGVTGGVLYSIVRGARSVGLPAVCAAGACTLLILAAGLCAVVALWSRIGPSRPPVSLLYFRDIAAKYPASAGSYTEALRAVLSSPAALADEIASQIWAISHVAARKYTWANYSLGCLTGSLLMLGATSALVIRH